MLGLLQKRTKKKSPLKFYKNVTMCGQQNGPPKMAMPWSLELVIVSLHGKRKFADGIKITNLKLGIILYYPGAPI